MKDDNEERLREEVARTGRSLSAPWGDDRLERVAENAIARAEAVLAEERREVAEALGALPPPWSDDRLARIAGNAIARAEMDAVGGLLRTATPPAWDDARLDRITRVATGEAAPEVRPQEPQRPSASVVDLTARRRARGRVIAGLLAVAACLALLFGRALVRAPEHRSPSHGPIAERPRPPAAEPFGAPEDLFRRGDSHATMTFRGGRPQHSMLSSEPEFMVVELAGENFDVRFDVAKEPGAMFRVLFDNVSVEDVGTVFTIRRRGERVCVEVTQGSVVVREGLANRWSLDAGAPDARDWCFVHHVRRNDAAEEAAEAALLDALRVAEIERPRNAARARERLTDVTRQHADARSAGLAALRAGQWLLEEGDLHSATGAFEDAALLAAHTPGIRRRALELERDSRRAPSSNRVPGVGRAR